MAVRDNNDPERRCILTGETKHVDGLVRFVLSPDGILTPDVAGKLPGRGIWISADKTLIEQSLESGQFVRGLARALKAKAAAEMIPDGLIALLDRLLAKRCLDRLGIEQKASRVITGFDKIKAGLDAQARPAILFTSKDAGEDGRKKMKYAVGETVPEVTLFTREELSLALGKGNVVHALLLKGGGLDKLQADLKRLNGIRRA